MSKPTLYFSPQPTRSARARWAFAEAGVDFEPSIVDVFAGEQRAETYLAVNPLGFVPAATFEGEAVIESSALALIAATGTALLPEVGSSAWRRALQWVVFAPAELDRQLAILNNHRLFRPPAQRNPEVAAEADAAWKQRAKLIADVLGDQPFLLGETFSIADVCVGHCMVWAKAHDLIEAGSTLEAYLERLKARPAFRDVYGTQIGVFPDPHAQSER